VCVFHYQGMNSVEFEYYNYGYQFPLLKGAELESWVAVSSFRVSRIEL